MNRHEKEIATALGDSREDTVRFSVENETEDFSLEYAGGDSHPMWNIANSPPCTAADLTDWGIVDSGRGYVLVESHAETAPDVVDELETLATAVGGPYTEVQHETTFCRAKSLGGALVGTIRQAGAAVAGVFGR